MYKTSPMSVFKFTTSKKDFDRVELSKDATPTQNNKNQKNQ